VRNGTVSRCDEVIDHQAHAEVILVADDIGTQSLGMCRRDHHGNTVRSLSNSGAIRYRSHDQ
jgi:hypothetical protein